MARTSAQLVTLACADAKVPGWISQAGQLFNMILGELCQDYDFDVAKKTFVSTFNPGLLTSANYPNIALGGGPYALPTDYLRMVDEKSAVWFLLNVPYKMIPCDLSEYDNLVQQAGNQAYPYLIATDMSASPPVFVTWPPPSGAYQYQIRYFSQMPDIVTPETSSVVPWFPNQHYLRRRLAGELMVMADDDRADSFLGDGPGGAQGIMNRYLKLKDDHSDRAQTVKLDRRRFGRAFTTLPNTKTVGWVTTLAFISHGLVSNVLHLWSAANGFIG